MTEEQAEEDLEDLFGFTVDGRRKQGTDSLKPGNVNHKIEAGPSSKQMEADLEDSFGFNVDGGTKQMTHSLRPGESTHRPVLSSHTPLQSQGAPGILPAVHPSPDDLVMVDQLIHDDCLMPGSHSSGPDPEDRPDPPTAMAQIQHQAYLEHSWNVDLQKARARERSRQIRSGMDRPGVDRSGICSARAVRQRRWPERPLSWEQLAQACESAADGEIRRSPELNFKIGVTTCMETRFGHYVKEGVSLMVLLHAAEEAPLAVWLERRLISCYRSGPRCRNVAPGGEGVNTLHAPVFVYIVFGGALPLQESRLLSYWPRGGKGGPAIDLQC